VIKFETGIAPLIHWDHTCGLKANCVYSGVPSHFVVKDSFSTLPIPKCFDAYPHQDLCRVVEGLYENQGKIFWPAGSNATNAEVVEGVKGYGEFRKVI
jgi:hypothetical protein